MLQAVKGSFPVFHKLPGICLTFVKLRLLLKAPFSRLAFSQHVTKSSKTSIFNKILASIRAFKGICQNWVFWNFLLFHFECWGMTYCKWAKAPFISRVLCEKSQTYKQQLMVKNSYLPVKSQWVIFWLQAYYWIDFWLVS